MRVGRWPDFQNESPVFILFVHAVLFPAGDVCGTRNEPRAMRVPVAAIGPMIASRNFHRFDEDHSCMNFPLDSRQLRAFRVLARTGSFTQTARELHLTQSGISHSVTALQPEIGCRLLDRLGKKVVLTQAGEQLLKHAEKILGEMDSARESLTQLGKWGKGRLRL